MSRVEQWEELSAELLAELVKGVASVLGLALAWGRLQALRALQ